ncbi:restriction endonuclease subunit S [Pseudoalteromonas sp. S201]|uniref:restriction endonuclease subunit S n=1 Tax=Pseudoalteromonas sp. S201 TaxID=579519 RepID=UPI001486FB17|nr:restriction endonuclease subunit S [Pseudoalteromonas sp. S201]
MSWPLVKLSEVAEINPRLPKNIDEAQEVTFLPMASISEQGQVLEQEKRILGETRKGFTYFEKNDVVVAKITPCFENGKAAYLDCLETQIGFGTTEFHVIRADIEKLDGKYLFYLVWNKWFRHLGERNMSGSAGQKRVPSDFLKDLKIPLPPLDEQKRIAAILDKADAIRRKRQQAIQLADDFLRSVFLDMFGDPVTNPKGWEVKQVGKVVDCIVPGRDKPKSFTGGMPWITTNDLNHLGSTYESEKSMGLSDQEIAAVKARIIPKNSVLMTCVGDLGVISIAGNDMVMNQQLHAFLPNENIEKEFLMYALSFQKHYMIKMASSTTVPYMNKTVCNSVPVILPAIEMQKKFTVLFKKASLLRKRLISTQSSKRFLFNSLSQKAFAGEL